MSTRHARRAGARPGSGCLEPGNVADLVVIDDQLPALVHKREDLLLDAMLFAGNSNPVRDVMVGGDGASWTVITRMSSRILERYKKTHRRNSVFARASTREYISSAWLKGAQRIRHAGIP